MIVGVVSGITAGVLSGITAVVIPAKAGIQEVFLSSNSNINISGFSATTQA